MSVDPVLPPDPSQDEQELSVTQPPQRQDRVPGLEGPMHPKPDHGEDSYKGCDKLVGKAAVITAGRGSLGTKLGDM
jgi:hypothetical protein